MRLSSQIIISQDFKDTLAKLESLRVDEEIIEVFSSSFATQLTQNKENEPSNPNVKRIAGEKKSFTLTEVKIVIEKSYLASVKRTVIILIAENFSDLVQNALLKVIEEPPKNKEFIFLTQSKSAMLPTIKSRLPIVVLSEFKDKQALDLALHSLSLEQVYAFTQTHKRTDTARMKNLIEDIVKEAISSQAYDLDEKTLTLFSNTFKALDVGSPAQFVLNTLLLKLLARKKR